MCSMLSLSTPGFPVLPPVPDPILGKFLHFMCQHVNSLMFTLPLTTRILMQRCKSINGRHCVTDRGPVRRNAITPITSQPCLTAP